MSTKSPQEQKHAAHRSDHLFRHILHYIERAVAIITLVVLVISLGYQIFMLFTDAEYLFDTHAFLQNILTIVVGLEFVRMLIDLTPANTIEVLIVAIARQVILTHNNPWANLASVLCIAGLFATRHFLIPKEELTIELSEVE